MQNRDEFQSETTPAPEQPQYESTASKDASSGEKLSKRKAHPLGFFDLPPEIRQMIYRAVALQTPEIRPHLTRIYAPRAMPFRPRGFFRTSATVFDEALPILLETAVFDLALHRRRDLHRFVRNIGFGRIHHIRSIRICLPFRGDGYLVLPIPPHRPRERKVAGETTTKISILRTWFKGLRLIYLEGDYLEEGGPFSGGWLTLSLTKLSMRLRKLAESLKRSGNPKELRLQLLLVPSWGSPLRYLRYQRETFYWYSGIVYPMTMEWARLGWPMSLGLGNW